MRRPGWLARWVGGRRLGRPDQSVEDAAGALSAAQIKLLLASVERIAADPDESGKLFYDRLFATAPEVRVLFRADMAAQQTKLIQTLVWVVRNLNKPEEIADKARELGRRHTDYGVEDEHYDAVGGALLWMVEDRLGPDFTADVRAAWLAAYESVAKLMKEATPA